MEWKDVSVDLDLEPFEKLSSLASQGVSLIEIGLDLKSSVIKAISAFQSLSSGGVDTFTGILSQLEDIFLDGPFRPEAQASCYLLDIPLLNPRTRRPLPPSIKSADLEDILLASNILPPGENVIGSGGNYGIYKKIIESLFDNRDSSRPLFDSGGEMGALLIVYGASSYIPALKLAVAVDNLLGNSLSIPPDVFSKIPVPQNVKVRPVAPPTKALNARANSVIELRTGNVEGLLAYSLERTGRPDAATVTVHWDKMSSAAKINSSVYWEGLSQNIYVKESSPIQKGEDLDSYKVLSIPIPSLTSEPFFQETPSIRLQGTPSSAMLTGLDPDKTYYISTAIRVRIVDRNSQVAEVFDPSISTLSEQVRVRAKEHVVPSEFTRGTPPDWRSLHSPLFIIPEVRQLFDQAAGLSRTVTDNFSSAGGDLNNLLDMSKANIEQLADKIRDVQTAIQNLGQQLNALSSADGAGAGIWATYFYGKSGRPLFMNKIAEALLSDSSVNKPPFSVGIEPAGALVFLVEGRSFVDVQVLLEPLIKLFNSSRTTSAVEDLSDNPIADSGINEDLADGSLASSMANIDYKSLGLTGGENVEDTPPASLHNIDLDDEPC